MIKMILMNDVSIQISNNSHDATTKQLFLKGYNLFLKKCDEVLNE